MITAFWFQLPQGYAGEANIVDEQGAAAWQANHPSWWSNQYTEWENGGAGGPLPTTPLISGQGLEGFKSVFVGAGANRSALVGEPSWFQNGAFLETGTTASGSYGSTSASAPAVMFSATSGEWIYETTFSLPVLSDAGQTYIFSAGFNDNSNGELTTDGCYIRYKHSINGGRFQARCVSNGVETLVDTGITVVAGNYYHLRVRITNNTLAEFWIKTTFSGGAWSDDGEWGVPNASISTTIPSSAARVTAIGIVILKQAGLLSRGFKLGYQYMHHTPSAAVGQVAGNVRGRGADGSLAWLMPQNIAPPIVFYAYGRGGFNPSASADFGPVTGSFPASGGTTSGVIDGSAQDNGQFGTSRLRTGVNAAGYAGYVTSKSLTIDAATAPMVLEGVFAIPTISTGAQQFNFMAGIFDEYAVTPTNGIYIEIDSNVDAQAQFRVVAASVGAPVDSGITITAGVYYFWRIVITSTQVDFYLGVDGGANLSAPTASITTNIPLAVTMQAGYSNRKLAGTTNRDVYYTYTLAYQRSTTSIVADAWTIEALADDNLNQTSSTPALTYNVPQPRAQAFIILSTAHLNVWGSSDVGVGVGGNADNFDEDHPNVWTILAGTPDGHVAVGPGGGQATLVFSATSGLRIYDAIFKIPVLSDAVNEFFVRAGFVSSLTAAVANGVYMEINSNTDPEAIFYNAANSVVTPTASGVTVLADTWYRMRIEIYNNSLVRLWFVEQGTAWPTAPMFEVTTDIPSGTSQATMPCITVKNIASGITSELTIFNVVAGIDRYVLTP